jgi:hypothetical protein
VSELLYICFVLKGGKGERWGREGKANVNVDFDAVNAVVDATHRYKEIFYAD